LKRLWLSASSFPVDLRTDGRARLSICDSMVGSALRRPPRHQSQVLIDGGRLRQRYQTKDGAVPTAISFVTVSLFHGIFFFLVCTARHAKARALAADPDLDSTPLLLPSLSASPFLVTLDDGASHQRPFWYLPTRRSPYWEAWN
jgi:hypothetical protein